MKKNQKGFSVVELLMVLVILILIGAVGWLVYNNQHKAIATNTSAQVSSSGVVKYTKWDQMPSDLQKAIVKAWGPLPPASTPEDPCPTTVQSTITSTSPVLVDNNAYAITGIGCDGGAGNLFVSISGSWQDVAYTQDVFSCSTLQQYNVPLPLLEANNIVENAGQGNGKPVTCAQTDGSTLTLAS